MKLTIKAGAFSSVVGPVVTLTEPGGQVVGQLSVMGSTNVADYQGYSNAVTAALNGMTIDVDDSFIQLVENPSS